MSTVTYYQLALEAIAESEKATSAQQFTRAATLCRGAIQSTKSVLCGSLKLELIKKIEDQVSHIEQSRAKLLGHNGAAAGEFSA
ncbi:hypothetical protein L1D14_04305 [Vibrio tubiashii]|uniref:hypothetical protein n=1 Tax=Vibrio tubiashii TaxID=29498 RepID=UPI001EFDFF6A|nr:hypothetical protein [Vibrio tubiashii]MCG9575454.1 hypothetical protein [Vibrio tubiashii]